MAVAIWDHEPSADELLADRLGRGWKPFASELRDGRRILGHAACLAEQPFGAVGRTVRPAS